MPNRNSEFFSTARKRFAAAQKGWKDIRDDAAIDLRFVNPTRTHGQWDPVIKAARENSERPALEFPQLHTFVQQLSNQVRQNRPQIKVIPGADGTEEIAKIREDRIRYIQYASQADVAYDTAVEYSGSCGFGFYRITSKYLNDQGGDEQEPRIERILDPMSVYFDPSAIEPDLSDAAWCFVRQRLSQDGYKARFPGKRVASFDRGDDNSKDWVNGDDVWIAEYWRVEKTKKRWVKLADGTKGYADELEEFDEADVLTERDVTLRAVKFSVINGIEELETTDWLGKWIPIIPVLGREVVVEGKRQFVSLIRYAHAAQKLLNSYKSGIAESIGLASRAPFIGFKGQFKDPKWLTSNSRNHAYLEAEPTMANGQPAPLPQQNQFEAPIQSLSEAALQESDDIRKAVGYNDAVLQPSRQDLSGIAVLRRTQQADLTNFHFGDNLQRSQWHAGRILLDLDAKLIDTPRTVRSMAEDGTLNRHHISQVGEDGEDQLVPGQEDQPHVRLDQGSYEPRIVTGPSYTSKRAETFDMLTQIAAAGHPEIFQWAGDIIWKNSDLPGADELSERYKLMLPPPIQASINGQQPLPPEVQAKVGQLQMQLQLTQQELQKLQFQKLAKTSELEQEHLTHIQDNAVKLMVADIQAKSHEAIEMLTARMTSIEKLLEMFHESELPAQAQQFAPPPAPEGAPQQ